MIVVICPGIHSPELTAQFTAVLAPVIAHKCALVQRLRPEQYTVSVPPLWVLPPEIPPYATDQVERFVSQQWRQLGLEREGSFKPKQTEPLLWIGFSAGVVGAVTAARRWQQRGPVAGLIAVDGWGVPLGSRFARFRISHDRFTAQSCEWLGASDGYFICEPAVSHLDLWRSPHLAHGRWHPNPQALNRQSCFGLRDTSLSDAQSATALQVMAQLVVGLASQAAAS